MNLNFLTKVLPWVGAAATGNIPALIALAADGIGKITGHPIDANPDSIAAAVAGATPDQITQMKKMDEDFQLQMQALGFKDIEDLAKIAADDRASARQREMTLKDRLPAYLAIAVTFGFFGVLFCMMKWSVPSQGHDALLVMLGSLGTAWTSVIAYYYGSSSGSDRKTELLSGAQAKN